MNDRQPPDQLDALRRQNLLLAEENARLKEMLELEAPGTPAVAPIALDPTLAITASSSPASKIELFTSLFRGRVDVHAKRWQSRSDWPISLSSFNRMLTHTGRAIIGRFTRNGCPWGCSALTAPSHDRASGRVCAETRCHASLPQQR